MEIEYRGHSDRTKKALELWLKVVKDYNKGMSPSDICKKYINPKTGKAYTRQHIYLILRRAKSM